MKIHSIEKRREEKKRKKNLIKLPDQNSWTKYQLKILNLLLSDRNDSLDWYHSMVAISLVQTNVEFFLHKSDRIAFPP